MFQTLPTCWPFSCFSLAAINKPSGENACQPYAPGRVRRGFRSLISHTVIPKVLGDGSSLSNDLVYQEKSVFASGEKPRRICCASRGIGKEPFGPGMWDPGHKKKTITICNIMAKMSHPIATWEARAI